MKKVISLFLSIIMLLSITAGIDLSAYAYTSGDFEYQLLDDGTAEITGYTGFETDLTIPSTLDRYTVTSIGDNAFYECYDLTSIIIPNSVTSIGTYSFAYCDEITNISLSNSLISIGDWAFYWCESLTSITIPNSVTSIGYGVFGECDSLTTIIVDSENKTFDSRDNCNAIVETSSNTLIACCNNTTIPNSITAIGDYAFYCCSYITSIDIPYGVTSIGYNAFCNSYNLTSITIPDSITSIDGMAFSYCCYLTSIIIPNSVTSIGFLAFYNCSDLTSIYILNKNCYIDDNDDTIPDCATIYAYKNSTAQEFAENCNRDFITLDDYDCVADNHCYAIVKQEYSSTCSKTLFYKCVLCEKTYSDEITTHSYINGFCTVCGEKDPDYIIPSISANETKTVNIENGGDVYYLEFTPSVDGEYTFYSTGDDDTQAYLYDEDMEEELAFDDDSGENSNFSITYDFEKGKTYYFACKYYNDTVTGTFDVTLVINGEKHEHNYDSVVTVPTCTTQGYTTHTCECGDSYVDSYVNATGHTYNSGVVTKAATCTATGTKTYTCTVCGETKTETISKTAHTYKTTTTKATTSKNGSVVTKCSVCGAVSSNTTIYYPKTVTLSTTSYAYDGKVKKPSVTVKDSKGNKIAASNYTVKYSSNKNVGKATVTITFKGNYSGTVKKTFTIKPKATTLSIVTAKSKGFTVKWKKQATQTTGYQIQYSTDKNFKKNNKTVTVSKNKTTSKTVSKLKAKKKYYVRVRTYKTVNGTKYYSSWSKAKTVTTKK